VNRAPGIVHVLADISHLALYAFAVHKAISLHTVRCHSNETCAPIANLPNSAQLQGTPIIIPTYVRVRAVVWACGDGQTHTCTD